MTSWTLEDIEEAHSANPDSFFVPSKAERVSQSVGNQVRLHFLLSETATELPRAERMWVRITEKVGSQYVGVLESEPRFLKGLSLGDRVIFGPQHIAQTIIRRDDPRWFEAAAKNAIVSRMIFADGEAVRWMYREAADDDDSGWRLFTGHESREYLDDPRNATVCSVGWLLDWDPSLATALRANVGTAFERASPEETWTEVTDWEPPGD